MGKGRFFWLAGTVGGIGLLAGCTSTQPAPVEIDWTNRACESPAYVDILGTYAGAITFRDETRACHWNAEISIIGVSMASECSLTGTITATPDYAGDNEYLCSSVNAPTSYVAGLSDENLNHFGPSSVIVHMTELLPTVSNDGVKIVNPIFQFEALTASGGKLITDAGYVLKRQ